MSELDFEALTPTIGVRAEASPEALLADGAADPIWDALDRHLVVLFPGIGLDDDQLVRLTASLGSMEALRFKADEEVERDPSVYRISLETDNAAVREYVLGNEFWHMDGTAYETPGKGTLLKCEMPPASGGDTGFANLFAAYEALPAERKRQLEGLRVEHCMEAVMRKVFPEPTERQIARWNKGFPRTPHPLVWTHHDGRKSLVIGSTAMDLVGLPHDEGVALLAELVDWCTRDAFTYRHVWSKGDLVIFNNPGLLHRSFPYDEASGRVMHRTTLKGFEAIA